ncbi:MAG: hypothetical protein K2N48_07300 [Muribaculaceae bacterium]|nr:hypothetical protein [Muribaculaceae bacterium]
MDKNTVKAPRITKDHRFADIAALLTGKDVQFGTTVADALEFIEKERDLLAKKNSADKKPTKTQEQNAGHKSLILDFLRVQTEGVTCTEIQKGVPEFADFNNQKVAALVRQLKDEGRVIKDVVKGKSLFTIADEAETEDEGGED